MYAKYLNQYLVSKNLFKHHLIFHNLVCLFDFDRGIHFFYTLLLSNLITLLVFAF